MPQNESMTPIPRALSICLLVSLIAAPNLFSGQSPPSAQPTERPMPPTRDPNTPGYVTAKELPDGSNPPANADGNFIIGATHDAPAETSGQGGIPQGTEIEFTMNSSDSKIYPGVAQCQYSGDRRSC
jgi:enterochelin esterase family protein